MKWAWRHVTDSACRTGFLGGGPEWEGRGEGAEMRNRKNSGAPTRKVKKHEKDKDNMESARKKKVFPRQIRESII